LGREASPIAAPTAPASAPPTGRLPRIHEDGLIVDANHAAGTVLGAPEGSLIGQPMSRFILSWSAEEEIVTVIDPQC